MRARYWFGMVLAWRPATAELDVGGSNFLDLTQPDRPTSEVTKPDQTQYKHETLDPTQFA